MKFREGDRRRRKKQRRGDQGNRGKGWLGKKHFENLLDWETGGKYLGTGRQEPARRLGVPPPKT